MYNYGKNLKENRILAKKTLLEVEKNTGVNNGNLCKYENNKVIPSIEICVKLADYYGVSLDELIGREFTEQERIKYNQTYIANNINVNNK